MRNSFVSVLLLGSVAALPAQAQSNLDGRVGKLESEMRAVQRKVFPGDGAYIEPQVRPSEAPAEVQGVPASSPVADLSQRVTALESQLATMTNQIEENQNRVRKLEDAFANYKSATDAKLAAGTAAAAPLPAGSGDLDAAPPPRDDTRGDTRDSGRPGTRTTSSRPAGPASVPRDAARAAQVSAIEKPASGDAAEDAYLYGYRLWQAKLYPEAAAQLKSVVTDFPKSRRASFAQNLLGRAYLDDGKPSLASIAFYDNYKKYPDGERAPESLLYLGTALQKLNKPADACKVYGELTDVYGAKISAGMKAQVEQGRVAAKCK